MIETIIIRYLTDHGFQAYGEEPRKPVSMPYHVIQKTGGGEEHHLRRATIAVQSYGETLYEAAMANEAMVSAVLDMGALDAISSVSLNSDYNFTDTAAKRYRYQAVFDFIYYGTEA